MATKVVFKDFTEYWYFARYLTEEQRNTIFESLSNDHQRFLNKSLYNEGWDEVFKRDKINTIIDELKESYGYDLIEIRCKAMSSKSVYIPSEFWDVATELLDEYDGKYTDFVLGGISAAECEQNKNVLLITALV